MRLFCTLTTLLLLSFSSSAQNRVPNPGFEEYDHLPNFMSITGKDFQKHTRQWVVPNEASTDLISPRLKSKNLQGIPPKSGKNMAGIVINGDFWSEYVGIKLKKPLEKGKQYYVEYWLSMPKFYSKRKPVPTYLNDYFGVMFSEKIYHFDKKILQGTPQVKATESVFVEPAKWTKVSGNFVADGDHPYLYIGQFWNPEEPVDLAIGYYFIDDVYVEEFSSAAVDYVPSRYYKLDGQVASVIMENIYFETDQATLLEESFVELNKLVNIMNKNPGINIQIQGHTDSQGSERHNLSLSERRSQSVYDYLTQQGIPAARLNAKGYGYSKPVADNQTDDGRQQNRRVEFIVSGAINKGGKQILGPAEVYRFSSQINSDDRQSYACIGEYKNCRKEKAIEEATASERAALKKHKATDAKAYISERIANEQVVFLNYGAEPESHWAFTHALLKSFREQGFTYLALPDLNQHDKELANRKYPVLTSANKAFHPVYGELIREALKAEFTLAGYRPSSEQIRKAENIIQKQSSIPASIKSDEELRKKMAYEWASALNLAGILKRNSAAKILVLCQGEQAMERNEGDFVHMASWFKRFAHIDALTIDQARMSPACYQPAAPIYAYTNLSKPTVYSNAEGAFVERLSHLGYAREKGPYDIQVFHKERGKIHDRPAWLYELGDRKEFFINPDKHEMGYPCLVHAYRVGEDVETAVPLDVIELTRGGVKKALVLPAGEHVLVLRDLQKHKKLEVKVD